MVRIPGLTKVWTKKILACSRRYSVTPYVVRCQPEWMQSQAVPAAIRSSPSPTAGSDNFRGYMGERRPGNGQTAHNRKAPAKTENDTHIICFKELGVTALGFHDRPRF